VDDVARERVGRGREIDEELGAGERVVLVVRLDGVGEAEEVALGDGDGEDAALVVGEDVEVAGHGVGRVLLGPDEAVAVVAVLGHVRAGGDAPEEARVLGLEDLLEARAELDAGLGLGHARLVRRREQRQPERAEHGVERERALADARDGDAEALVVRLGVARADHDLQHGEGRDHVPVRGEDARRRPALLLLVPARSVRLAQQ
jgi:hypothetical protein